MSDQRGMSDASAARGDKNGPVSILWIIIGVVCGWWVLTRIARVTALRSLAKAGVQATVQPLEPLGLPTAQLADEQAVVGCGFTRRAVTQTDLPGNPIERMLHLVDEPGRSVARVMTVAGVPGEPSVTVHSWFPGGHLATTRSTSMAVNPLEATQCFPGAAAEELIAHHRDALTALGALGAVPIAPPADLGAALQLEWRTDAQAIADAPVRVQLRWAAQLARPDVTASPLVGAPDLETVARKLRTSATPSQ